MKKISFIVNPISGGKSKKKIIELIDRYIDRSRYEVEVLYTKAAGHATELARQSDADIVVAVGGDGTVNEVASGLVGSAKALSIIPCGSGDGLALHLGMSRNHRKAVQALNDVHIEHMDCATLNGRYFFCTCGAGFDALIGWNFAHASSRGLITYVRETARAWFSYHPDHYVVEADGVRWEGDALMITVGNASQWGNNARITPLASVLDGELDVTVVKPFRLWRMPGLLVKLMTGRAHTAKMAVTLRARRIDITRTAVSAPVHLDGDPAMMGDGLHVEILPKSLYVAVPADSSDI